jgi:polysaccharide pyruvyl transferase WcaK-like protein
MAANRITADDELQLQQCMQLYQEADIVMSSALHGCIIGAALGKKVVAVSGDRKIDSFMESIGWGEWLCSRDRLDELPSLVDTVHKQESCLSRIEEFRNAQREIGRQVRTLISSTHVVKH